MTRSLSLLDHFWRVALLLAAGLSLTPGRASAECGEYVTIVKPGPGAQFTHAAQPARDHDNASDLQGSDPIKLPCHGPNCSRSPSRESPPFAPVNSTRPAAKELVHHPVLDDDGAGTCSGFVPINTPLRPIDRTSPIFHPPRIS